MSDLLDLIPSSGAARRAAPPLDTTTPIVVDEGGVRGAPAPAAPGPSMGASHSATPSTASIAAAVNEATEGHPIRAVLSGGQLIALLSNFYSRLPALMSRAGWGDGLNYVVIVSQLPKLLKSISWNANLLAQSELAKTIATAVSSHEDSAGVLVFQSGVRAAWSALHGVNAGTQFPPRDFITTWHPATVPLLTGLAAYAGLLGSDASQQQRSALLSALAADVAAATATPPSPIPVAARLQAYQ